MNETPTHSKSGTTFQKVAECLYRNTSSGRYYAFVKVGRKQYRRSLKTNDRPLAGRFLSDFRNQVAAFAHEISQSGYVPQHRCPMARIEAGNVKTVILPATETSIGQLNARLGDMTLRQITPRTCEEWAGARGPGLSASSYNNERDTLRIVLDYAKREGLLLSNPGDVSESSENAKAEADNPDSAAV